MEQDKTLIAIDPGSKGFIAARTQQGTLAFHALADNTTAQTADFLRQLALNANGNIACCIEEIHAIFGASAKSTFSFGETFGTLKGLLTALNIPYHLVPPKTWQREIWTASDKVTKTTTKNNKTTHSIDNKATSINAATRLFPNTSLCRTPNCKKPDDNKADALLILEYAKRKNI